MLWYSTSPIEQWREEDFQSIKPAVPCLPAKVRLEDRMSCGLGILPFGGKCLIQDGWDSSPSKRLIESAEDDFVVWICDIGCFTYERRTVRHLRL